MSERLTEEERRWRIAAEAKVNDPASCINIVLLRSLAASREENADLMARLCNFTETCAGNGLVPEPQAIDRLIAERDASRALVAEMREELHDLSWHDFGEPCAYTEHTGKICTLALTEKEMMG